MVKEIIVLTESELLDAQSKAEDILIANHREEFERIREAMEFNARQAKADKKDRD